MCNRTKVKRRVKSASNLRIGRVGLSPTTQKVKNKNQTYVESYKNREKKEKQEKREKVM